MSRRVLLTTIALAALLGAACGSGGAGASDGRRVAVVTTVAPITSIVANIGGDRVSVRGLVPEGTNSHTFEPPPSAAASLAGADAVFLNGLGLEEPIRTLAEANATDGVVVALGEETIDPADYLFDFSFPPEAGRPNPHLWTSPLIALRYADVVRETLTDVDPDGAATYTENHAAYADRLRALDDAVRAATDTVAADQRRLLTYHDSFAYFAEEYGWEVIGAIQPSTFAEPSPREVARLIEQVEASGVPAVFGSEVFPSPVLERIGEEAGVRYVDVLRDDDLPGEPGDADHTFLALLRFDFVTIVEALGGDASALEALDTSDVVRDRAEYPQ